MHIEFTHISFRELISNKHTLDCIWLPEAKSIQLPGEKQSTPFQNETGTQTEVSNQSIMLTLLLVLHNNQSKHTSSLWNQNFHCTLNSNDCSVNNHCVHNFLLFTIGSECSARNFYYLIMQILAKSHKKEHTHTVLNDNGSPSNVNQNNPSS